jgi:2-oxoglutarate/2-oxoacid ferredoxin oxidoreductase subunit alpha
MVSEFNIMVGGEAGQGIQSVGAILAASLGQGGFFVFADQDYESRVRGGHNFFRVRAKTDNVQAISPEIDLLLAFNKETIDLHEKELKKDGIVVFDAAETKFASEKPNYLDVPLLKLALEKAGNKLMVNTVAAGAALGLAGLDFEILTGVLAKEYGRHGEQTVKDNVTAARAGYDFALSSGKKLSLPQIQQAQTRKLILSGNEALCLGALAAGCKFVAGYPMTPSSSILEYIADKGRQYGTVMMHVEDEIAAMNMAVGAGYAGVRSMVATSGGGFALMVEGLALAGMTETPVVVVLGQRPGPATGLPTRTEQGELFFALHAGHGEFARAVFAPADASDAFSDAVKAFNLAEKYQTPVLILTDNHLATSYYTVDRFDLAQVKIDRGNLVYTDDPNYKRHLVTDSGVSPRALPGLGKALVVTDSDEHDEAGHMIEDAATRKAQVEKRLRKLNGMRQEVTAPEFHQAKGAALTLIGWGSTYGAIQEAADILKTDGTPVNTVHFKQLWPFAADAVISSLKLTAKNIVVEGNATSQLAALIKRETGIQVDGSILKYDGRPFSPREIVDRLHQEVKKW